MSQAFAKGTTQSIRTPQIDKTNNALKIFLQNLGDRHSKFCANCRTLIAESLNFFDENKILAGSRGTNPAEPAAALGDDKSSYGRIPKT